MLEQYQQHCLKLEITGIYRQLPDHDPVLLDKTLDFSSNDYLALSQHPCVLQAALDFGKRYGTGATGSRLLSGNHPIFTALEARIAKDKHTQAALIFNSGFQANLTVLSSLLDARVLKQKPIVFFDRLNHASLYQAVFLSQAELVRYQHLNYDDLSKRLKQYQLIQRPKFIVTETIFGMDGDIVSLDTILHLAREHNAFVYLDEAHALGIIGKHGYGLSTTITHDIPMVALGTLSKGIGCSGAYIACDQIIKDYIINQAGGFMFSTAPSPMVIGAALKAWELIATFDHERHQLFELAGQLRERLQSSGFHTGSSLSHIIPLIIGQHEKLYGLNQKLIDRGIRVSLIRRPTVPPGGERLRIALNIHHTPESVNYLIQTLNS